MDKALLIQLITSLYLLFNSARVLSYLPQIWAVSKEESKAQAISLLTWGFWTLANFTTGLYASFVAPDFLLSLMSYGNALGCGIVVGIVLYKRVKYASVNETALASLKDSSPNIAGDLSNVLSPSLSAEEKAFEAELLKRMEIKQ